MDGKQTFGHLVVQCWKCLTPNHLIGNGLRTQQRSKLPETFWSPLLLQVLRITAWSLSKSAYKKTHKTGLQQKIFLTSNLYHSTINLRISTRWRSYWNILTVNLYLEMMLFLSSNNCLTLWYMLYFVTDLMPLCNLKAKSLCSVFLSDFVMIYVVSLHYKFWRSMKFASLSLPLSIIRRQFHMVKRFCGIYYW